MTTLIQMAKIDKSYCLDFLRMSDNSSTDEAIRDEFEVTSPELAKMKSELVQLKKEHGGSNGLAKLWGAEPVVEKKTPAPEILDPEPNKHTIAKTSEGLRDALFDAMQGLRDKSISPQEAVAMCKVSESIIDTIRIEIAVEEKATAVLRLGS